MSRLQADQLVNSYSFQPSACFAGENGSRAVGDADALLDVLQQFSPFCWFESMSQKSIERRCGSGISETALIFEKYGGVPFLHRT